MSYQSGWKAINLEFSARVPRTEYSAQSYHWPLVQRVTGIDTSIEANREKAKKEFVKKWDYAFMWMTPGGYRFKEGKTTKMGHAEYAAGGTDFDTRRECPFKTLEEVYNFDPCAEYERRNQEELVKELNAEYIKTKDYWGDAALTMGGVYHTIFSGLIEIFGWEMLLLAIGKDSKRFNKVIESYYHWIKQYFDAWARTDCKVFMSHDDICWTSGPVTHPDWYRRSIFPYYKRLWEPILSSGKKIIFTSDGKYDIFFDDIVRCGANMLVMEPGNDMKGFAEKYGKTHGFVGNADTRILLLGTKEDIYKEVKRCMDIGKEYPGFIMAVGNHIPPNTPVDNALYYNEAYMKLSKR
ncbi:MAG: hypothetical protein COZ37_04220 [bacterium (Candidatus Ratteibacteria) CG_4_10_14_3_um_filter_41_18]|uniref:Uroporphyrinogen decarboxylase (URO-D) domain-containing protein n=4 Tax=Candidatus Ratteibacteria TaxID=2979319 RepID=A0A2M7E9S8_9BACT|nr:MAG: hypothetical protein COS11_01885 [bacterium (Candidatus Ratteibacteria) CG01_land_8_20_14_3_00_40_19]PIW34212.1 MAG: hypothetical protein COW28_00455 [bacterium (Candidatus Ratteibacteria) CG15_BIG_FIL_POST_REV_8_21_14_020_41_12]PIX77154.1 MAG: hypothetical protein COZ37_04220 [bacterium (Candidatus Ratteibacteria) CG_4_10_14_3_um_filter_41_18]